MRIALFISLALGLSVVLQAQQISAYCNKGKTLFERGKYEAAYPLLMECVKAKPRDVHLRQMLNQCLYLAGKPKEALNGFRQMRADFKKLPVSYWLYLGRTLQVLKQFEEAARVYKDFLRYAEASHPQRARVYDDLLRCATGIHLQGQPTRAFVQNLGPKLNGSGDELRPIVHPQHQDLLYFSSARPGVLGGLRNSYGEPDEVNGSYPGDMFRAELQVSGWSEPESLGVLLNSNRYDIPAGFSSSGETFYFFQGYTTYSGEVFVDTTFRQVLSAEGTFFAHRFDSPMLVAQGDTDPFWYADDVLLFASRREGGYGGLDLYITRLKDGQWTSPQNLGPQINTPYDERSPFLAKDGRTLYFSTNHPDRSFGYFDIVRSVFNDLSGRWSQPYNLGLDFNSAFDDMHFFFSEAGDRAWFVSNRPGGYGGYDLYLALFSEQRMEQKRHSASLFTDVLEQISRSFEDGLSDFYIEPLYLEEQGDSLTIENKKKLRRLLLLLNAYPTLSLQLIAHSDPLDYDSYSLFFSLKNVERVGDFLIQEGLSKDRMSLWAVGDHYPVAKVTSKSAAVRRFNRRIDIFLTGLEEVPVKVEITPPAINEDLRDPKGQAFLDLLHGLSYKVELTRAQELFPSNIQLKDPHAAIEKDPAEGIYYFTVGLTKSFDAARTLQKKMLDLGFSNAQVVPYLNGIRLNKNEIEVLVFQELYPELKRWLSEH